MNATFSYAAEGRSARTIVVVILVWLGILILWWGVDAHPVVVAFLSLFTLPACWDIVTNPKSGLELTERKLSWFTGKRHAEVELTEVDHVQMNTRLDFSVKVTLVLRTGIKLGLPFESTPPSEPFEKALVDYGLKVRRTHFQLMQ